MTTLALLQARTGSQRLPGKVLRPILGRPMLERQIERVRRAGRIDRLVVATTTKPEDAALVELCEASGVCVFRGDAEDVLHRFANAARPYEPKWIVRLTGDCPLIDPEVIDAVIETANNAGADYISNTIHPTFPDGLDVEVFRPAILFQADREATRPSDREHVTPFIWRQPDRFRLAEHRSPVDLSHHRWTVDEPEDFDFVSEVYKSLHEENTAFGMADVLRLLAERPELLAINNRFERNEGYQRSLENDPK